MVRHDPEGGDQPEAGERTDLRPGRPGRVDGGSTDQLTTLRHRAVTLGGAPGPGRDTLQAAYASDPTSVFGNDPGGFQVTGFSYLTYTGDVAMMNLAIGLVGGGQASVPVTLEWSGQDWLVQVPADGNFGAGIDALPTLAGYVPWSGA